MFVCLISLSLTGKTACLQTKELRSTIDSLKDMVSKLEQGQQSENTNDANSISVEDLRSELHAFASTLTSSVFFSLSFTFIYRSASNFVALYLRVIPLCLILTLPDLVSCQASCKTIIMTQSQKLLTEHWLYNAVDIRSMEHVSTCDIISFESCPDHLFSMDKLER